MNVSIKKYIALALPPLLSVALFAATMFFLLIPNTERAILVQKREMAQSLVNSAWSILASYQSQVQSGVLSRVRAEAMAMNKIEGLRFGSDGNNFFWITDKHPRMIVHPHNKELIGTDLSDYKDAKGKRIFKDFVSVINKQGAGWVDYHWRRKNDPNKIVPKISYVMEFKPWGWIIGTGIYYEDVTNEMWNLTRDLIISVLGVLFIISGLTSYIIWRGVRSENQRGQAERALTKSEDKFSKAFRTNPVWMAISTMKDGRYLDVNDAFSRVTGFSRREALGLTSKELGLWHDFSRRNEVMSKLEDQGNLHDEEVVFRSKDGRMIDAIWSAELIEMGGEKCVVSAVRDITAQKHIEKELMESEERYRSLFECSKDAIVTTDARGNILMANQASKMLFGLTDAEMLSKNFGEFYVDSAMGRKFLADVNKKGFIRDFGVQLYKSDGLIMDCLMTVSSKYSPDGTITGYEGIIRDVTPFKELEEELRRLATTDSLTGLNTRRNFMELTKNEIRRSWRYKAPLSMIMLDIDHFKNINDTYGHSAGDLVLRELAVRCMEQLRSTDIMGRLGGEEFAVTLVESDSEVAAFVAERIRKAIAEEIFSLVNEEVWITISIGVATRYGTNDDIEKLLERADKALYLAKANGRNRVEVSDIKVATVQ
ncbi:MAG: diguanylate cyclase [Proteobacteria bacterium]|nr:diguanylate cyclase [Pseudomonadota bacterium]MBU2518647.1 diguanylate cyclase [Pseudomonadota bacterium]